MIDGSERTADWNQLHLIGLADIFFISSAHYVVERCTKWHIDPSRRRLVSYHLLNVYSQFAPPDTTQLDGRSNCVASASGGVNKIIIRPRRRVILMAFHDADSDTDTDTDSDLSDTSSDTRDFLARILARKSVSVSVSVSALWNASYIPTGQVSCLFCRSVH